MRTKAFDSEQLYSKLTRRKGLMVLFIFLAVLAFGVIAVGIGAASLGLTDIDLG